MGQSIWDLKVGDRISLDSGAVAEVIAPTEDGEWVLVKYVEAPESLQIIGTQDLCRNGELQLDVNWALKTCPLPVSLPEGRWGPRGRWSGGSRR